MYESEVGRDTAEDSPLHRWSGTAVPASASVSNASVSQGHRHFSTSSTQINTGDRKHQNLESPKPCEWSSAKHGSNFYSCAKSDLAVQQVGKSHLSTQLEKYLLVKETAIKQRDDKRQQCFTMQKSEPQKYVPGSANTLMKTRPRTQKRGKGTKPPYLPPQFCLMTSAREREFCFGLGLLPNPPKN